MELNEIQTEAVARAPLAAAPQELRTIGAGTPVVLLPEGYTAHTMEHRLAAPARKKGTTVLNDAESSIALVNDQIRPHKTIEHAVKELRAAIAAATGLQILNGAPSK